jgi:acetyl-CoA carboxylase biotin carboxyl carrier protein
MEDTKVNDTKHQQSKLQAIDYYELMKTENLEELEIKDRDFYIYLKRKSKNAPVMQVQYQMPVAPAAPRVQAAAEEPASSADKPKGESIKSPIIGTLYRAPSPTSSPFVKEDDIVEVGKTLCIIEAMKVMNEIKAEFKFKILKILVENGKPVVSGQDLFLIDKNV